MVNISRFESLLRGQIFDLHVPYETGEKLYYCLDVYSSCKKSLFYRITSIFMLVSALFSIAGCNKINEVFSGTIKLSTTKQCNDLTDDECRVRQDCDFNAANIPKCTVANTKGTCEDIQEQKTCNNDTTCTWLANKCVSKSGLSKKNVTLYKIAKIDAATTHNIADANLNLIAASGDGNYVYFSGGNDQLAAYTTEVEGPWIQHVLGADFSAVLSASDHVTAIDMSGAAVQMIAPYSEGVLLWVSGKGVIQLSGAGVTNTNVWSKNTHQINNDNNALFVGSFRNVAGNEYFYLQTADHMDHSIVFIEKKPANAMYTGPDWNNSFVEKKSLMHIHNLPITNGFKQVIADNNGDLLFLIMNGSFVFRLPRARIGTDDPSFISHPASPQDGSITYIRTQVTFKRNVLSVSEPTKLLLVGKYLVVGAINALDNTLGGGIAVYDTSSALDINLATSWQWLNKDLKVNDIIQDKTKPERALILTSTCIVIFDGDDLVAPLKGNPSIFIDHALTNNAANKANVVYANHNDGFDGVALPVGKTFDVGAQDKNGVFYFRAQDDGAYSLKIETVVVNP